MAGWAGSWLDGVAEAGELALPGWLAEVPMGRGDGWAVAAGRWRSRVSAPAVTAPARTASASPVTSTRRPRRPRRRGGGSGGGGPLPAW